MKQRIITIILSGILLQATSVDIVAQKKGNATANASKTATPAAPKKETVNDVKRQQGTVQKEIATTRAQIKENEAAVKKGLAELSTLQNEIAEGKKKLDAASLQVKELTEKIAAVETSISKEEGELKKLRDEYLKAVKKMRVKRKSASTLSFLFSSKNFSEAMRRLRYLREFSRWREKQSAEIAAKVAGLKVQKEELAKAKSAKDVALREEANLHSKLQGQYKEQDAMVIKLKANGEALKKYLAQKQAEANVLKNRVGALISEEQRRVEAERKAKEEAARKAEQARREEAARQEAARKAEEKRKEEAARKEAEAKAAREREIAAQKAAKEREIAAREKAAREKAAKEADAKKRAKMEAEAKKKADAERKKAAEEQQKAERERQKAEQKAREEREKREKDENKNTYAEARRRNPRASGSSSSKSENVPAPSVSVRKPAEPTGSGFAGMKGSLPRPVAGAFRITSQFGRHSLPDLPGVMYDNPGIDAEVSSGASAQAVYGGKVSGVYVVPGYSTVVIINHGSYYTVYGNIEHASVKVGESVKQGQTLGRLAPSDENPSHGSIHFEVWHNRDKMNPADWIR